MIATNRCAARFLAEQATSGPFISHPGFRKDRRDEVARFLEMHAPDLAHLDPDTIGGYRDIMRGLATPGQKLPLRSMANRLLTRAQVSATPGPHMGMALPGYTNCTSPLRKYVDFLVHLQIKARLADSMPAATIDQSTLDAVQARIATCRAATLEAERWLTGNYLARLTRDEPITFRALITHVTSSGFTVRLSDNGLSGFIDLRKDPEKFSYDKWTASLTSTTRRFTLGQEVELTFQGVDPNERNQALFEPVSGCGLKEPAAGS